jgi:hypothetical protein
MRGSPPDDQVFANLRSLALRCVRRADLDADLGRVAQWPAATALALEKAERV